MPAWSVPAHRWPTVLRGVAVLGLAASVLVAVAGWALLAQTQRALADSLQLTGDALAALDASAGVATDTVEVLAASLAGLEATAADLDVAFADGEALLVELAGLLRTDVAGTLRAVEGALPGVIEVAATIDTTLAALALLPFGPDYDPAEPFAASLQDVADALEGVPEELEVQADVLQQTAGSLDDVGDGIGRLVDQLAAFDDALASTADLLATYDDTIADGQAVVEQASAGLAARLWLGRIALLVFAVAFAAAQLVPLHLAEQAAGRGSVG